eukprot:scaffold4732_cov344-Prasinococcus_capsulatus_cf.AAC.3
MEPRRVLWASLVGLGGCRSWVQRWGRSNSRRAQAGPASLAQELPDPVSMPLRTGRRWQQHGAQSRDLVGVQPPAPATVTPLASAHCTGKGRAARPDLSARSPAASQSAARL